MIDDGEGVEENQWTNTGQDVQFGQQLPEDKKKEIHQLLSKYRRVTKDTPGHTDHVIHKIRTTDSTPIRQKSYRIPQTFKSKVYEELEHMEKNTSQGIPTSYNCEKGWRLTPLHRLQTTQLDY